MSTGRLIASRMMARVRTPPAGMPAAPTLDAVAVILGRRGKVREASPCRRSYHESPALPARVHSQGRGQLAQGSQPQSPSTHRMVMICTKSKGRWLICAMNTAATHWKSAAPSMLTVAPMGRMKRQICLETPFFSSTHFIIIGKVAELPGTTPQSELPQGPQAWPTTHQAAPTPLCSHGPSSLAQV